MLAQGPIGSMGQRKGPGAAMPPTPITPSSSGNNLGNLVPSQSGANFAALLNTAQGISPQLQRAFAAANYPPTPPSTIQRTTVGLPASASGQTTTPGSKPPNDPLLNPKNTTNVYVNNLPLHTPDESLFRLCCPYGKILSVRVFHREDAPVPGSYGFVLFETLEDARRCIVALHRSRYQASFAKTTKIPNPLLADQLLLPFMGIRDDASSLYVRGLAKNTDQHTLELLFVPHFVISFRLGDELSDGTISWPTIEKEMGGKENLSADEQKNVKCKVALVRLKDHDTAEEMIDKLDGAYVREAEAPLSVRFAEAGAWRRAGSNRSKPTGYGGYNEEGRLNDAGWVGVDLPNIARVQPSPAFFNMGLGTMGIQQPLHHQQLMNRTNPAAPADWIPMTNMPNLNYGMNDLTRLQALNGLQGLASMQNQTDLAALMSLNLSTQLGLPAQLPLNTRGGLPTLDGNALNSVSRQDMYGPAFFTPAQLQSPVSIRNPNAPKASSPNAKQSNPSDFRNNPVHPGGTNPIANASVMSTPTSAVRAPPPSPCSPQNTRTNAPGVFTPNSFLSSLPAIPEALEDGQQNHKLNEALAAQLLGGGKSLPDNASQRHNTGAHMITPHSSQPSSQTVSPSLAVGGGVTFANEQKGNIEPSSSQHMMAQNMPEQRPRTPARGVTVSMPSAPAAAHLSEKTSGLELSLLLSGQNNEPAAVKLGSSMYHAPLSAPVPAAVKDDKSPNAMKNA